MLVMAGDAALSDCTVGKHCGVPSGVRDKEERRLARCPHSFEVFMLLSGE
jgi:hypothetical protein